MRYILIYAVLALNVGIMAAEPESPGSYNDLRHQFRTPPVQAKPWVLWFWNSDFVSRESITWEMEAYQRSGVGGLLLFPNYENLGMAGFSFSIKGVSANRAEPLSDAWYECIRHTIKESKRLGMQLCFHNEPGYSGAGGPWVSVADSPRGLVQRETIVQGPAPFNKALPAASGLDYRDVAVVAYPAVESLKEELSRNPKPKITASSTHPRWGSLSGLSDSNDGTCWVSDGERAGQAPTLEKPEWISFEYAGEFTVGAIWISPRARFGPKTCQFQQSKDGKAWSGVKAFTLDAMTATRIELPPTAGRCFRLLITSSYNPNIHISELRLLKPGQNAVFPVPAEKVLDLSSHLSVDGHLDWTVPAGEWKIIRYGHASTGKKIHPASPVAEGYETDKMNPAAVSNHFEKGMMGRILAMEPKLNGTTVVGMELDSYEGGGADWTPAMRQEFQKRRGYDPLPWLAAWHRKETINSLDQSERFREDMKRTISELCADSYYGEAAAFCHRNKLKLYTESYGTELWDLLTTASRADVPQAEFWVPGCVSTGGNDWVRQMAGPVHTTGKRIVSAEAFTHGPVRDPWWISPGDLKAQGDNAYCLGLNHTVLHAGAHQFWQDRVKPGMTFDLWGTPFSVNQTWWEPGRAWMEYQARCHALLQQGRFVADTLVLVPFPRCGTAPYPVGHAQYNFDLCAEDVFLDRARCENGRIVLGDMQYRLVVLLNAERLRPQVLAKLSDLVQRGAVVLGTRPLGTPGLEGGGQGEQFVQETAAKLWGPINGKNIQENQFGQGRVFQGVSADQLLSKLGVLPAVEVGHPVMWIHRQTDDTDLFFLSNQKREVVTAQASFRVQGRKPELWDPLTGEIRELPEYKEADGRTTILLRFEPHQSWFVVFKSRSQESGVRTQNGNKNFPELKPVQQLTGAWEVAFDSKWGGPAGPVTFAKLEDWTTRLEPGIKYYSGTAVYQKLFDLQTPLPSPQAEVYLELGVVHKLAEVSLNGQALGILWCPPWRVRLPAGLLKPKDNQLSIKVTNTWVNRLIGDEAEPDDAEWSNPYTNTPFVNKNLRSLLKEPNWLANYQPRPSKGRVAFATYKHLQAGDKLQESGLLGTVRIMVAE